MKNPLPQRAHRYRVIVLRILVLVGVFTFLFACQRLSKHRLVVAATQSDSTHPQSSLANPDMRCASCHAAIYKQYEQTAMARGSGAAKDGFLAGEYQHKNSGVNYRVFLHDGIPTMSYQREYSPEAGALEGERELRYFIGSGQKGRTFLYEQEGFWYELPINYYTRKGGWEMTPAFENVKRMPAPLPTDPNCLHCHATDVSSPREGARNHLGAVPFKQGGVGCNACHGDPSAHLAQGGHGPIVNPSKLSPAKRDSTCLQCHLEGNAMVYRPDKSLNDFKAGDDLNDIAVYFVTASQALGGSRATSQYEALLQSACKRGAGDKLTCTTCHNPHGDPSAAERVRYFRAKCLSCHTNPELATRHHPDQQDCAACHMPSRNTSDIAHEQVTDHNIQARPGPQTVAKTQPGEELLPVGQAKAGDRELGLAYAQLAVKGDRKAGERSFSLLSKAEKAGAHDELVHLNLAFFKQITGDIGAAQREYAAALSLNRSEASALSNLAVLDARAGDVAGATSLFQRALLADPAQTGAGLNLAFLQCSMGQVGESRTTVARLRVFNPDSPEILNFLRTGRYLGQRCDAMVPHK